jgi:hypothetical protein
MPGLPLPGGSIALIPRALFFEFLQNLIQIVHLPAIFDAEGYIQPPTAVAGRPLPIRRCLQANHIAGAVGFFEDLET